MLAAPFVFQAVSPLGAIGCWVACRCDTALGCATPMATTSNRAESTASDEWVARPLWPHSQFLLTGDVPMDCGISLAGQRPCGHMVQVVRRPPNGVR